MKEPGVSLDTMLDRSARIEVRHEANTSAPAPCRLHESNSALPLRAPSLCYKSRLIDVIPA